MQFLEQVSKNQEPFSQIKEKTTMCDKCTLTNILNGEECMIIILSSI